MIRGNGTRRRIVDWVMSGATLLCVGLALLPLLSILYETIARGARVISFSFFTLNPPAPCNPALQGACSYGGIANALVGTLVLVGLASLIALPFGILLGIYLSEYSRGRFGDTVRFIADVMTGLPSIVIGIFVYGLFLYLFLHGFIHGVFSAFAGSVALSVIMIPIVARTCEEALRLVPNSTREAALALGIPKHRMTLQVVLSTGRTAVITGALLAIARAGGETAPLIMTAFGNTFAFQGIDQPTASLPLTIFTNGLSAYPNQVADAWGATLVLVALMLLVSVGARLALRQRLGGARNL